MDSVLEEAELEEGAGIETGAGAGAEAGEEGGIVACKVVEIEAGSGCMIVPEAVVMDVVDFACGVVAVAEVVEEAAVEEQLVDAAEPGDRDAVVDNGVVQHVQLAEWPVV